MLVVRRVLSRFCAPVSTGKVFSTVPLLLHTPAFKFAKISKKKEEKIEKSKEKEQARSKVSNSKEIDLEAMEKEFKNVANLAKTEMQSMKLGRMDPSIFSTIYVKVYNETTPVSELAQIVEKNINTCIVNPYN
jgi:hypothetical protein